MTIQERLLALAETPTQAALVRRWFDGKRRTRRPGNGRTPRGPCSGGAASY
jgi:hypothetical protein